MFRIEQQETFSTTETVFKLRELILQSARMLSFHAAARNMVIRVHIDRNMPEYVREDPNRLLQVLSNLLGSTVKFSATSSVLLRVDVVPEGMSAADAVVVNESFSTTTIDLQYERYVFCGDERDEASMAAVLREAQQQLRQQTKPRTGSIILRFLFIDSVSQKGRETEVLSLPELSTTGDADATLALRISREVVRQLGGECNTQRNEVRLLVWPTALTDSHTDEWCSVCNRYPTRGITRTFVYPGDGA